MFDVAIFLGVHAVAAAALCGPAWWFARTRATWFLLDYATVLLPFVVWIVLVHVMRASLSNFIEVPVLVVLIPALICIRVFVMDKRFATPRVNSTVVFAVCILGTVALRAFMPDLPE